MKTISRPSWDEYFVSIAHIVQTRSNCIRGARGAILTKDKRIITTGYNGTPSGIQDCDEGGCKRCLNRQNNVIKAGERKDLCICVHAEQNALIQASLHGISVKGATLYATTQPCVICAKMLINAGIKEIVITEGYPDKMAMDFLKQAKIKIRKI